MEEISTPKSHQTLSKDAATPENGAD